MKFRLQLACTSVVLAISLLLCSCSSAQKQEEEVVQNHSELTETESFPVKLELNENDEGIIISEKPHRLAVLSADLVQALSDIGAGNAVAAVCNDAPQEVSPPGAKMCGTALDPDLKVINETKPDWILVSSDMRERSLESIREAGFQVIQFPSPKNIDEICARYKQLFTLCYGSKGRDKAQNFIDTYQKKFEDITSAATHYSKISQKRNAIYLAAPDFTMASGESFEGYLLDSINVYNLGELGSQWHYPENEMVGLDPDLIFYNKDLPISSITENPAYQNCSAVKNEQLFPIDFSAVRLKGLPMLEQLSLMAKSAYPQAFHS